MDRENYLQGLEAAIRAEGYAEYYIAKCIRYACRLIDNNLPVIFDIPHLASLIGISPSALTNMMFRSELFYSEKQIPKKRGGYRTLQIPAAELKYIQRWILDHILSNMHVSEYATGFCSNKSILDNAQKHVNQHCIVNIDIKDFFPSVSFERVFRVFSYYGYTKEVSFALAKLCTYEDQIPQGSPASPAISNIVCLKLDARLSALANKYEAVYSRYADDITFSSQHDAKSIIPAVKSILNDEGFQVNDEKTRIAYPYQRQEVTGLIVNGSSVRIPKQYKRDLYQEIYYCTKYGLQDHMERIGCNKAFYKEHLYGKILFVNMVEPTEGKKMADLANKIAWDY